MFNFTIWQFYKQIRLSTKRDCAQTAQNSLTDVELTTRHSRFGINTAVIPAPIENFFISTIPYLLALCNSGLAVTFVTLVTLILFWLKPGRGQNLNQKWSGIRIRISGLIRIRIQMTAGLLPKCRRQSFRRMSWKSASDCIWNVNKFPKIRYSAMAREVEKWSGIRIRDRNTTKT